MKLKLAVITLLTVLGVLTFGYQAAKSSAADLRDCSTNSIDSQPLNGGCGAASPSEFAADARANNPNDLQNVYSHFGLSASEYTRFEQTARQGMAYTDGRIVVDGVTVGTGAWSIGRTKFSYATDYPAGNKMYYKSAHTSVLKQNMPVMVMFNDQGEVEFAVLNACGNPAGANWVKPSYACKSLNMTSKGNDTYSFTSNVTFSGNAKLVKVVYDFGDGTSATKTSTSEAVSHKFTKSSTVRVTAYFELPGGKQVSVSHNDCAKSVTVTPPFYQCVVLVPRTLNDQKTSFRFTVKTSQGNGATLKNVDFALDGKTVATGVTAKDADGNVYHDISFNDTVEHTVVATVNFNVAGGVKSDTCRAKVTPKKQPICTVPGKEHLNLPPDSPECKEDETPPPTELPNTGIGSLVGIFAATSVGGAIAHRLVWSRRFSR